MTLTDAKGTVIARASSDKKGDSIATNALVSVAMRGQVKADLVHMQNNGLSIGCATPVMKDGKILGTILFGDGFRTHSYVNDIAPWINNLLNSKSDRKNGKKRIPATVSRYCSMLRSIFNFAITEGWIVASPMRRWKKPKETPRRFQLTRDDAMKIMEQCSEHTRWAMEVCFNLGLRPGPSELLSLRYDSVNFEKATVTVYATKTKTYREIPVKKEFLEHLREKRKESKQGFVIEFKGKPLKSIHHSFRKAVKKAGITYPVCLYDLRHMFATFMLSAGADLSAVSKLMGHHSVKMTADTYYQYMKGEKERAISLLPSLTLAD